MNPILLLFLLVSFASEGISDEVEYRCSGSLDGNQMAFYCPYSDSQCLVRLETQKKIIIAKGGKVECDLHTSYDDDDDYPPGYQPPAPSEPPPPYRN